MASVRDLGIFMSNIYCKINFFIGKDLTLQDKWNSSKKDVYTFRTKLTDWKSDRVNFWNWVSSHTQKHPELYLIKGCVFLALLQSKMTEELCKNLCLNTCYLPEEVWKTWIETQNMGLFSATMFYRDILLPWAEKNITLEDLENFTDLKVPIDDRNLYKEVPFHVLKDFVVPNSPPPLAEPPRGRNPPPRQAPPSQPSLAIRTPGQQQTRPQGRPNDKFIVRSLAQLKALFGR